MKTKTIITLIVLIAIIATIWFIDIPMRETTRYIGFDQQAKQNPYLAAQRFINSSHGLEQDDQQRIEVQQGLALVNQLPSTDDTLIITSPRSTLSTRQHQQLQQWVENGGHLIVIANNHYDFVIQSSEDPLLDDAAIQLHKYDPTNPLTPTPLGDGKPAHNLWTTELTTGPLNDERLDQIIKNLGDELIVSAELINKDNIEPLPSKEQPDQKPEKFDDYKFDYHKIKCEGSHELLPFPTETNGIDAYAHIHSDDFLYSENSDNISFWSSKGNGPEVLQIRQGSGRLTVLTSNDLWQNDNIFCYDSAYFLQFILNYQRPNQQKTWILYNEIMPSIMQLLWRNHQYLVWTSLLLLLAWLWQQTLRIGPIYNEQYISRRAFVEHLEAATRYRWQSGEHQQIIEHLRHYIFAQMNQRHHSFGQQPIEQQTELIAQHLANRDDVSLEQIHRALFAPINNIPEHQVEPVRILQKIRKHL